MLSDDGTRKADSMTAPGPWIIGAFAAALAMSGEALAQESVFDSSGGSITRRTPYVYRGDPRGSGYAVPLENFDAPPTAASPTAEPVKPNPGSKPVDQRTYPGFERPFPNGFERHTPKNGYTRPFSGSQGFQRPMPDGVKRHTPTSYSRPMADRKPTPPQTPGTTPTVVRGTEMPAVAPMPRRRTAAESFGAPTAPEGGAPVAGGPDSPPNVIQLPTVSTVTTSTTVSVPVGMTTGQPGSMSVGAKCVPGRILIVPSSLRTPTNEVLSRSDVLYGPTQTLGELTKPAKTEEAAEPVPSPMERAVAAMTEQKYHDARAAVEEHLKANQEDSDARRLAAVLLILDKETLEGLKRLERAYQMDPTLSERPLAVKSLGLRTSDLSAALTRVIGGSKANGEARSMLGAAVIQQAKQDLNAARRFLDRGIAAGLSPEISVPLATALTSGNPVGGR
jgi:hypothetical protein